MSRTPARAFTLVEGLVALLVFSLLSAVAFISYNAVVSYTQQQFVNASAEQLSDQLCAAATLNSAPVTGLTQTHLNDHIDDIRSIDVEHIAVHPELATHMQLKGTTRTERGYAYVQGDTEHYAVFPLNDTSCSTEPAIMTSYPQAAQAEQPQNTSEETYDTLALTGKAGPAREGILDRAIYSENPIAVAGNFTLSSDSDAVAIHTNSQFTCSGNSDLQAFVHTAQGAQLSGNCEVDGIWSNDTVTISGNSKVRGPLTSAQGDHQASGNATVEGQIYLKGDTNSPDSVTGTVNNQRNELPEVPTIRMPKITYAGITRDGAASWEQTIQSAADANNGRNTDPCSISPARYSLAGPVTLGQDETIIDATSCPTLTFKGLGNKTLIELAGDVTLVVNDFAINNTVTITSADGQAHWLRIISPWRNITSDECQQSGGGDIRISGNGIRTSNDVLALLYTPGTVSLQGNVSVSGQLYGCTVQAGGNTNLDFNQAPSLK